MSRPRRRRWRTASRSVTWFSQGSVVGSWRPVSRQGAEHRMGRRPAAPGTDGVLPPAPQRRALRRRVPLPAQGDGCSGRWVAECAAAARRRDARHGHYPARKQLGQAGRGCKLVRKRRHDNGTLAKQAARERPPERSPERRPVSRPPEARAACGRVTEAVAPGAGAAGVTGVAARAGTRPTRCSGSAAARRPARSTAG